MASISMLTNQINQLNKDITSLNKKMNIERSKETAAVRKRNKAQGRMSKTKSQTTIKSIMREIDRANGDYEKALKNQAELTRKLTSKSTDQANKKDRLLKEQTKVNERQIREQKRQKKKILSNKETVHMQTSNQHMEIVPQNFQTKNKIYDVFISHASEDKEEFVKPLAEVLRKEKIEVWYDDFTLEWGMSIRQSIDKGLANSKFGIVIISKA